MLVHCDTVKVASYVVPYPLEASNGYQGYYGRSCYKNGHVNSSLWGRSLIYVCMKSVKLYQVVAVAITCRNFSFNRHSFFFLSNSRLAI